MCVCVCVCICRWLGLFIGEEKQIAMRKFLLCLTHAGFELKVGLGTPKYRVAGGVLETREGSPLPTGWQEAGKSPYFLQVLQSSRENSACTITGEGGRAPTSYVPSIESFFQDFRAGAAPGLPGQLREGGRHASRDGRGGTATLRWADVTPAIALVMAGRWGGRVVPGPAPLLRHFDPALVWGGPPRRSHGLARPPSLGLACSSPEGTRSVKSMGGSITPMGDDFAAAGNRDKD